MASGLATRCSACGTIFRVVPDQLRVSEGWVRCGRCAQVFNAAEALLDLETGAPRRLPDEITPRPALAPLPPAPMREVADFRVIERREPPSEPESEAPATTAMPVVDDSASRFPSNAADDTEADPRADPDDKPATQAPAKPATDKPTFLRQAERAARWRSRPVRAALWMLALLGSAGLVAQVLYEYRDLAAARHAGLRPLLEQGCNWLGCSVGAARSINDLSVESSGLVRVEKSSVYRLSVALRNRAPIELALPALELALTDSAGQLVSRRVLTAAELGVTQATLAAGRELTLQATLQAATAPVAGYTIELFYP
jgi:predicted Zn finger-like uncharacterized protein